MSKRIISLALCVLILVSAIGCKDVSEIENSSSHESIVLSDKIILSDKTTSSSDDDNSSVDNNSVDNGGTQSGSTNNNGNSSQSNTSETDNKPINTRVTMTLTLEKDHPGVPEMDATYSFKCVDNESNISIGAAGVELSCDNSAVKTSGLSVIVPFRVRQKGSINITATKKNDRSQIGTYTLKFTKFTDNPTFKDEFDGDTIDTRKWVVQNAVAKDGKAVMSVTEPYEQSLLTTENSFYQGYGSYSASMEFTDKSFVAQYAFWMQSRRGDVYIQNPEVPSSSHGEIDIIEWTPIYGHKQSYSCSLHWMGWYPGQTRSNTSDFDDNPAPGITNGFHILSCVRTEKGVYFYYDGNLSRSIEGGVEEGIAPGGMYVRFDLNDLENQAWWGGTTSADAYPFTMRIDWFRSYGLAK